MLLSKKAFNFALNHFMGTQVLSNAQAEVLEVLKQDLSPEQLLELRKILVAFKLKIAYSLMDELWEENNWTEETMQQWAHEHNRTPYALQK